MRSAVVIGGSMRHLDLMERVGSLVNDAGLRAITPQPDEPGTGRSAETIKREHSRRHMWQISEAGTVAVLVVNLDRAGQANYVGPNAFAELAVGFARGRQLFLLRGMPEWCAEELRAWDVECLNGDLCRVPRRLGHRGEIDPVAWGEVYASLAGGC